MRAWRLTIGSLALAALTACGNSAPAPTTSEVGQPSTVVIPPNSSVSALHDAGTIRIGVKVDIPGLGYRPPGTSLALAPTGFDIEVAKIIAARLDIAPDKITWVPLDTFDREPSLTNGTVDLVVATYTMTPDRAKVVGQAGPYYITGQQVMVRADSDVASVEDLAGQTVCSIASSETDTIPVENGAITKAYGSYAACVDALLDGELDAISTDGAILMGFQDQHPAELQIVGEPFTTKDYGVGYRHGDTAMCQFLNDTLLSAYSDGSWKVAFESTLGKNGVEAPVPPRPEPCPA